jgi:hypothetical protein
MLKGFADKWHFYFINSHTFTSSPPGKRPARDCFGDWHFYFRSRGNFASTDGGRSRQTVGRSGFRNRVKSAKGIKSAALFSRHVTAFEDAQSVDWMLSSVRHAVWLSRWRLLYNLITMRATTMRASRCVRRQAKPDSAFRYGLCTDRRQRRLLYNLARARLLKRMMNDRNPANRTEQLFFG